MNHDDCARLSATAPATALGALDPDEAGFVRAHLAACPRPHPELGEGVELAAAIGASWPDEDIPSPRLRHRILAAARSEPGPLVAWRPSPSTRR